MTCSQTAVIRRAYRAYDQPIPVFNCPVLFAARVLRYASDSGRFREVVDTLLSEAAEAADLVERLSEPVEYIDFAVRDGNQTIALRMRFVERHGTVRVCMDFLHAPDCYRVRPAEIASATSVIGSKTR